MINPDLLDDDEEIPDWAPVISAAKAMGVAPWELVKQPKIWQTWGNAYAEACNVKRPNND